MGLLDGVCFVFKTVSMYTASTELADGGGGLKGWFFSVAIFEVIVGIFFLNGATRLLLHIIIVEL